VLDSVLEGLMEEPDGSVVAHVRAKRRQRQRCGVCGRRGPLYDQGEGRRRWRGLDVGFTRFCVEAAAPRTITYYRADIEATLQHGVNNGRAESLNTKVRLIARRAFGFHSAPALIAMSELTLGGLCPSLPGRQSW
jgi:transposase